MGDVATNVPDTMLPNTPVRQGVVSLPFELRGLAATKPDVLTDLDRIFTEKVARVTKHLAGVAGAETDAVSFPQCSGSSSNLRVHVHPLAVDAVFERDGDGRDRFQVAPPEDAAPGPLPG
ncbi:MAG: hypothetical protein U0359_33105 [Byssovorax sp.]